MKGKENRRKNERKNEGSRISDIRRLSWRGVRRDYRAFCQDTVIKLARN